MPEWCARRWRRWSKKPTPVEISARPAPSRSRLTLTNVSPVSRSTRPVRAIILLCGYSLDLPQPHRDALGVVLETLEARQTFGVRAKNAQGLGGEVDVVGAGGVVRSEERRVGKVCRSR